MKVLGQLQQLQILYYHGNAVSELKDVDTLSRIKTLIKLSLHGNPIDQNIGVCFYTSVLSMSKSKTLLSKSQNTIEHVCAHENDSKREITDMSTRLQNL